MSLAVDYAGFAEGATFDTRGNSTLVGFNPQVLFVDELPAQIAPFLVLAVHDDEMPEPILVPGKALVLRIQLSGPEGETLFVTEQRQPVQAKRWKTLPHRIQVLAQIPFAVSKAGDYTVALTLRLDDATSEPLIATASVRISDQASLEADNAAGY